MECYSRLDMRKELLAITFSLAFSDRRVGSNKMLFSGRKVDEIAYRGN